MWCRPRWSHSQTECFPRSATILAGTKTDSPGSSSALHPSGPSRWDAYLLSLYFFVATILLYSNQMQPDLLEELFFSGLIGSVQIDSVIPYILNMQVGCFSWVVKHISLSCDAVGRVWGHGGPRGTHWDRVWGCQGRNPIINVKVKKPDI